MNTPTPRTDVVDCGDYLDTYEKMMAHRENSRLLERELVEAQKDRDEWKEIAEGLAKHCLLTFGYYSTPTWEKAREIDSALDRFNAKKQLT